MTVIYVYLRHGPKEYKNGKAPRGRPQHDPPITKSSIPLCQEIGSSLLKNYGIPKIVIVSPYLRTRQTGKLLTESLPYFAKKCIYTDNNVAEYLGNQRDNIDVTIETLDYAVDPITSEVFLKTGETITDFNNRIREHLNMLQIVPMGEEDYCDKRVTVFWIITHGFTISTIYDILKENNFDGCNLRKYYPEELEGLVVKIGLDEKLVSFLQFPVLSPSTSSDSPLV
jgi:broad specificity phosphatase PhoE